MYTNYDSFESGCCSIRTARQKNRIKKEDFDKHLLGVRRLQDKLYKQKEAQPLVPLEVPYQRGWERTFVLRDDVARSNDAEKYKILLAKINTVRFSRDKLFRVKGFRNTKRIAYVEEQLLREFSVCDWHDPRNRLTEAEKRQFYLKEYRSKDRSVVTLYYAYADPWRFVLQVRPHIITHVKLLDEVVEQQLKELDNYIERNHLGPRLNRLTRGMSWRCNDCYSEPVKYRNPLKNKPLHSILEAAYNDYSSLWAI